MALGPSSFLLPGIDDAFLFGCIFGAAQRTCISGLGRAGSILGTAALPFAADLVTGGGFITGADGGTGRTTTLFARGSKGWLDFDVRNAHAGQLELWEQYARFSAQGDAHVDGR